MKLQNIIVILGPPGSGKGTQSKLLVEKLGYAYFSMGGYFREVAASNEEIKAMIDKGLIVPDAQTEAIFRAGVDKAIVNASGLVLDGFPRTLGQIEMFKRFLNDHSDPRFHLLFLDVDKQKLINRLLLRSKIESRVDDTDINLIGKRFDEYMAKTVPVKSYFSSNQAMIHINGDQPVEAVHQEIMEKLGLQ
ncbi:MAG: hypothetical protein A3B10_03280 [Candidatus Doudnabacteria bacterium RIFCSPLOWO2_01_FULL_44_21]|uniref:Adenylate kinase n=1 Tax=Candidatus Doudnabacteria bacterium RIFCSPLOWO2_01_FULL_44_21 TaxID=1817841 RepID=A0A1F5PXZ3_9BACT|nr:MAG: hypothetical protein A3B95_02570 [Candidatus Doudnabacteria bacterium RIFCSPHIGHO2_02_FULL_43_13b]OGE94789.1 MAG: hypothetical protein A3B10_03280 [Candidatus Doudnabacteria bacterium RIFCSPLOWO2_01_FULL_44_21]